MQYKVYCVYIITNFRNSVLYTGITSSLKGRVWLHKNKIIEGFTSKYNCSKLVYYEVFEDVLSAIEREKEIKKLPRIKKVDFINLFNPSWEDLFNKI